MSDELTQQKREKLLQANIAEVQPATAFTGDQTPWNGLSLNNHRTLPYPKQVQSPDGQDYGRAVAEIQVLQLLVADLRARVTELGN
jgi:hypothetical protein